MKRTTLKFSALPALLGLLAHFSANAFAAGQAQNTCSKPVNVMPDELRQGMPQCSSNCQKTLGWIQKEARDYETLAQQACGKTSSAMSKIKETTQQNSQSNVHGIATDASAATGQVLSKAETLKQQTPQQVNQYLQKESQHNRAAVNEFRQAKAKFADKNAFDSRPMSEGENPFRSSSSLSGEAPVLSNAAEFMHKLAQDKKEREESKKQLDDIADKTKKNEENAGPTKKEEGKGMDPSALAGPLAALAGMANQKKPEDAAASDVSNPAAAEAAPTPVSLGSSKVKGTSLGSGSSKTNGGGAKIVDTTSGQNTEGGQDASQYASGLSTSGSGPYKDAFTGFGANGTTPGTFSPSGGGASGGGGSGGSGENGERVTASSAHSPAEEEALSSFGGGGLNFAGGGGSSSSHSSGDEGVKDFLQDAESTLGDSPLSENPEGELAASEAGVEGEDGTELFRRVRSALERSQRKGAVLSGLSGPKDPRYR